MIGSEWTKTEKWHRHINGTTLAIRLTKSGKWEWCAQRYSPGVHERGETETLEQAMDAASSVAI